MHGETEVAKAWRSLHPAMDGPWPMMMAMYYIVFVQHAMLEENIYFHLIVTATHRTDIARLGVSGPRGICARF